MTTRTLDAPDEAPPLPPGTSVQTRDRRRRSWVVAGAILTVAVAGVVAAQRPTGHAAEQVRAAAATGRPSTGQVQEPAVPLERAEPVGIGSVSVSEQLPGFAHGEATRFKEPIYKDGKIAGEIEAFNLNYRPNPPVTDFTRINPGYNISVFDGLTDDDVAARLAYWLDEGAAVKGSNGEYAVSAVPEGSSPEVQSNSKWTTVVFSPRPGTIVQVNGRMLEDEQLVAVADRIQR